MRDVTPLLVLHPKPYEICINPDSLKTMKNLDSQISNFCKGEYDREIDGFRWRVIFQYFLSNVNRLEFSKEQIHTFWTVNGGHLRRKIKDDQLIADVLTLALPRYHGDPVTLYRGECSFLYEAKLIGFCWTPDQTVAERFASGLNAIESGGVLLRTLAQTPAILSGPNEHSSKQLQEFEYTCNPFLLNEIVLVEHFERDT